MWGETSAKTGEGVQEIFTALGTIHFFLVPRSALVPSEHFAWFGQPRQFVRC